MSSDQLLSQKEKRFVYACSGGMLFLLLLLLAGGNWLWLDEGSSQKKAELGFIDFQNNDIRQRSSDALVWKKTKENAKIHLGDSIFAGEKSHVEVRLKSGGKVDIGENSLVVFSEVGNQKLADLINGNFRIAVNGRMKISVQGQMTEIEGDNAELQIFVDSQRRPQFKILKGEALVQMKNGPPLKLNVRSIASGNDFKIPKLQSTETPHPVPVNENLTYVWHLYDLYEQKEFQLFEKERPQGLIKKDVQVNWMPYTNKQTKFKLSPDVDFKAAPILEFSDNSRTLHSVYFGDNFWRVSYDGLNWSVTEKFTVKTDFLPNAEPKVRADKNKFFLSGDPVTTDLLLQSPIPAYGFVAQLPCLKIFLRETTRTFWSAKAHLRISFFHEGFYYYRFRTVSLNQELSQWSKVQRFMVYAPPPAPVLPLRLSKKTPVVAPPPPEERRQIAVDDSGANTMKYEPELAAPLRGNEKYRNSSLSMEGFLWTLQSSQQYYQTAEAPVATGVGLHALHWWDHSGLEGQIKSGVFGANKSGQKTALRQAEARYHYRFFTGFPFGLSPELQVSLFGGYEMYRNSGGNFASRYDLIKFGTSLEFPLANRWSSGGELVYGTGLDSSTKQEISGHLNYFLSRDWSFGVGYRLHLFQAGSVSSAAGGELPYREGYTEGYSILDYHFLRRGKLSFLIFLPISCL